MAFILGLIMMITAVSLFIYIVASMVGLKEGLIIIGISILVTFWVVISGLLISTNF